MAAVLRRDARVLICRRPRQKRHGGLWEFPGGKLHPGETLGEGARRELAEELGLVLTGLTDYLGSRKDPGSPFRIHFVEGSADGEPAPLEHDEVLWVLPRDLERFNLAPGDRSFVKFWLGASAGGPD